MSDTPRELSEASPDPWVRALAAVDVGACGGPGRALRVKLGYNPNSSSVGSVLTTLLWTTAVASAALNVAASLVRREVVPRAGAPEDTARDPRDGSE